MKPRGWCQHCRQNRATRPRQLCHRCYYTPGIKELYPVSNHPTCRQGSGLVTGPRPLPSDPDPSAWPGSDRKLELMAGRAKRGEQLHHPSEPAYESESHYTTDANDTYTGHGECFREINWQRFSLTEVFL